MLPLTALCLWLGIGPTARYVRFRLVSFESGDPRMADSMMGRAHSTHDSPMKHAGTLLMAAGALLVLFYPALWVYGKVSQYRLHQQWQQQVAAATPGGKAAKVIGRLSAPSIYLDQIVVEGVSESQLAVGPGHFPQTALPGDGNCVIAGHLNVNGSPFRDLERLQPGDTVAFETEKRLVEYRVQSRRIIDPDDVDVLKQTGASRLELITCTPGARHRLLILCKQTKII